MLRCELEAIGNEFIRDALGANIAVLVSQSLNEVTGGPCELQEQCQLVRVGSEAVDGVGKKLIELVDPQVCVESLAFRHIADFQYGEPSDQPFPNSI